MPNQLQIQQQLQQAIAENAKVNIVGNNTKAFLSGLQDQNNITTIRTISHQGIIGYEPDELVIQVRAGTSLEEVNQALAKHQQILSFEPPHFGQQASIGGVVASGLTGTSQPWVGRVKDSLLGATILDAQGQINRFGGQVFKNVAGFDAFRPQAGSWGSLGIILEVSLRTNPAPKAIQYFSVQCDAKQALKAMLEWQKQPLPLSSLCWQDEQLYLRLSGLKSSIISALKVIDKTFGNKAIKELESNFWLDLAVSTIPEINQKALCCWQVPPAEPLQTQDLLMIDWGGARRWYLDKQANKSIYQQGYWEIYPTYPAEADQPSRLIKQPLAASLEQLQRRFIRAFDPQQRFNCPVI